MVVGGGEAGGVVLGDVHLLKLSNLTWVGVSDGWLLLAGRVGVGHRVQRIVTDAAL